MKTQNPSYIVADISEPHFSELMNLRSTCCGRSDKIPAEITLAGSSGVGPIPIGTEIPPLIDAVSQVLKQFCEFNVSFSGWNVFPNTTVAYLEPRCRKVFDNLHLAFRDSGILFSDIPFQYNPHCTIGSSWAEGAISKINSIDFPKAPFLVNSISILDLNPITLECNEIHRFKLSKSNQ